MTYDQWKTASPFDDEIDFVEQGEKWLKRNAQWANMDPGRSGMCQEMYDTYWLVKGLCEYIEENT